MHLTLTDHSQTVVLEGDVKPGEHLDKASVTLMWNGIEYKFRDVAAWVEPVTDKVRGTTQTLTHVGWTDDTDTDPTHAGKPAGIKKLYQVDGGGLVGPFYVAVTEDAPSAVAPRGT